MNTHMITIEAKYEELFEHRSIYQNSYHLKDVFIYDEYFKMFIEMTKNLYKDKSIVLLDNEKCFLVKVYTTVAVLCFVNSKDIFEKIFGISLETLYVKFLNGSFTY